MMSLDNPNNYAHTEIKFGMYMHKRTGKIAIVDKSDDEAMDFSIDSGETKPHPFLRTKVYLTVEGQGLGWFNYRLKHYEYLGEL